MSASWARTDQLVAHFLRELWHRRSGDLMWRGTDPVSAVAGGGGRFRRGDVVILFILVRLGTIDSRSRYWFKIFTTGLPALSRAIISIFCSALASRSKFSPDPFPLSHNEFFERQLARLHLLDDGSGGPSPSKFSSEVFGLLLMGNPKLRTAPKQSNARVLWQDTLITQS
jgi:hypothetical protein